VAGHILNKGLAWTRIPSTISYWSIVRLSGAGGRLVTRTTLPHHARLRDPRPPPYAPPPTAYPIPNGRVLLDPPTRPFITQSGCLAESHPVGRALPSLAIVDRPALPLRWPDQPALPPQRAPGQSLLTLHTRMLSFCVCHSALLICCCACGDELECCWSVRAFFTRRTSFCVHVWKTLLAFSLWCCPILFHSTPYCPVLPHSAPYCPVLPRTAPLCPILPRTAPYCPKFPFLAPCCGHLCK